MLEINVNDLVNNKKQFTETMTHHKKCSYCSYHVRNRQYYTEYNAQLGICYK